MTFVVGAFAQPLTMTRGLVVLWGLGLAVSVRRAEQSAGQPFIDGDPAAEGPGGSLLLTRGEHLFITEKFVASLD